MEKLLDFSQPLDVSLIDQVVSRLYSPGNPKELEETQKILVTIQEHPDMWRRVDAILENSQLETTKRYALTILENAVKTRWHILPVEQRDAIKNYIVEIIIKISSNDQTRMKEDLILKKLDDVLVQILNREWLRNWKTFIPEVVNSSKSNESLCENNLYILKLMSEEIFDYSAGNMTKAKIQTLKDQFNKEFSLVYQLCDYVLNNTEKQSLILGTLETLLRFLNWIPLGYIFETKMIDLLVLKFFPVPAFRNVSIECLTEIGSLSVGNMHDQHFLRLYVSFMQQLAHVLPPTMDLAQAHAQSSFEEQKFLKDLSLFFTGFFKSHLNLLDHAEHRGDIIRGHEYLAKLSVIDDVELFNICLEYWHILTSDLYHQTPFSHPLMLNSESKSRAQLFGPVLSQVRVALVTRMARPEEVCVVEDEHTGGIIRERTKDTANIVLYKSMRATLIFLTHLDPGYEDTQLIMLTKLHNQVTGSQFSWNQLNTLCWAIGSISGAMNEESEKRFLVTVIRDLLNLCEVKRGKDNKAVIASNIMYIVGQYPRFLRAHWRFLSTVVNKLFEFMHEKHPGVQDMAVDTFLKIVQKCHKRFIVTQMDESKPFVEVILQQLSFIISDLEPQQIHTFYEALGYMIASQNNDNLREKWITECMALPNERWGEIMEATTRDLEFLKQADTARSIANVLKANIKAAYALGPFYINQLGKIYMTMLNVYKVYSEYISHAVATEGEKVTNYKNIKYLRGVKKEALRLLETFIKKSNNPQVICQNFLPPLLEAVLGDYKTNIAAAREPEVLSLLAVTVSSVKKTITPEIPKILDAVFECTLGMITGNFQDYPTHRTYFYDLLRAIDEHCFASFFMIPEQTFKLIIDSLLFGIKHTMRDIAETALSTLLELWSQISKHQASQAFYQTYFLSLLKDVFVVLTDTFHKSGFKLQAEMLLHMIHAVESNQVVAPLFDPATSPPDQNNAKFLREHMVTNLTKSFETLNQAQVTIFVKNLFAAHNNLPKFKSELRDFLVQMKEFAGDNTELYLEEKEKELQEQRKKNMTIPGMVPPNEVSENMALS